MWTSEVATRGTLLKKMFLKFRNIHRKKPVSESPVTSLVVGSRPNKPMTLIFNLFI